MYSPIGDLKLIAGIKVERIHNWYAIPIVIDFLEDGPLSIVASHQVMFHIKP